MEGKTLGILCWDCDPERVSSGKWVGWALWCYPIFLAYLWADNFPSACWANRENLVLFLPGLGQKSWPTLAVFRLTHQQQHQPSGSGTMPAVAGWLPTISCGVLCCADSDAMWWQLHQVLPLCSCEGPTSLTPLSGGNKDAALVALSLLSNKITQCFSTDLNYSSSREECCLL